MMAVEGSRLVIDCIHAYQAAWHAISSFNDHFKRVDKQVATKTPLVQSLIQSKFSDQVTRDAVEGSSIIV